MKESSNFDAAYRKDIIRTLSFFTGLVIVFAILYYVDQQNHFFVDLGGWLVQKLNITL